MIRGPMTCKRCGELGHRQASYKCPLNGTKKRPPRKPRKNTTKARPTEPSTPQRSNIVSDAILHDSPGVLTRKLAILRGEGSSSQPTGMTTSSPTKKTSPRKMTPKKRKTK